MTEYTYINNAYWDPPEESANNYAAALQKAIYFYQQQRSGVLPDNNTVIWRGDSFLGDGADVGLNLTGGYFNDGGYLKLGLPIASTVMTLAWSVYEYQSIFDNIGQLDEILDAIKWGTDYLIRCHPTQDEYYFQVGDISRVNDWRGPVESAHMFFNRPSYKVNDTHGGSAVTAATAAALALSSIIFNETDPDYALTLLTHAEQLDNLAWNMLSDDYYNNHSLPDYQSFNGFWDELSTSGILLYMKTDNTTYLEKAENATRNWPKDGSYFEYRETHSWDDMHYIAQIFLSRETSNQTYVESIERNLDYWLPSGGISYTPGGLAYCNPSWAGEGSLRFATNAAFLASLWSDDLNCTPANSSNYRNFAESQINYTLGENPYNRSYLIGFGNSSWQNISHRTAHGSWMGSISDPEENRHILYGALVGGPRSSSDFWNNQRSIKEETGVACDYNAGYIGALAKMTGLYGGFPHIDFPNASWFRPKNITDLEYYGNAVVMYNGTISTEISVDLTNHGTWPAKVADMLSYRYYLNLTEVFEANYSIDDITINLVSEGGISITVSNLIHLFNNTYYVVVDYTGVEIYPGQDDTNAKESTLTFSLPSGALNSEWDPTNDWSFQGLNSTRYASEYIPVYDDNVLVYGKAPNNDTTPPDAPTGLVAAPISDSQIGLDWNDNVESDFDIYRIYRSIISGFTPNISNRINQTVSSDYSDNGLNPNTIYYYLIIAVDTNGNPSTESNQGSATTNPDNTPPDAPTGLVAAPISDSQIGLDWNDNVESDFDIYRIYRSTISGFTPNISNL
ncbi:MAG: glycoside hydrolase family 9 protein, partial [Candidatus Lokiarchaeota archaeon]|nr:glycoside hydrolase family 9 protein [Candidatus Lokiarchaeota archaeon]